MTAPTQAEIDRRRTSYAALKQAEEDEQTALKANKASGKAKLKAGEALNDAEVSALFGD